MTYKPETLILINNDSYCLVDLEEEVIIKPPFLTRSRDNNVFEDIKQRAIELNCGYKIIEDLLGSQYRLIFSKRIVNNEKL